MLEFRVVNRIRDLEDVLHEVEPELLRLLLLVPAPSPTPDEIVDPLLRGHGPIIHRTMEFWQVILVRVCGRA